MIKIKINWLALFFVTGLACLPFFVRGEAGFLQLNPGFKSLKLNWSAINLEEAENLVLIRKENACPKNFSDGREVYRGNGNSWEDKKVMADRSYCYGIFKQDLSGRVFSLGFSETASIQNLQEFLGSLLTDNRVIFSGFVLALLLFWINKKTTHRREKIRLSF